MSLKPFGFGGYPAPQPPAIPTLTLTGGGGGTYRFEVYPLGQPFKKLPGVYAICKETAPKVLGVLYIGETHDLDARVGRGFVTHHKWVSAILDGATHICVLVVGGDKSQRLRYETDLRHGYNPPLNDQ